MFGILRDWGYLDCFGCTIALRILCPHAKSSMKSDKHELATQVDEEEALPKGGCTIFTDSLKGSGSVRLGEGRFMGGGFLAY